MLNITFKTEKKKGEAEKEGTINSSMFIEMGEHFCGGKQRQPTADAVLGRLEVTPGDSR